MLNSTSESILLLGTPKLSEEKESTTNGLLMLEVGSNLRLSWACCLCGEQV